MSHQYKQNFIVLQKKKIQYLNLEKRKGSFLQKVILISMQYAQQMMLEHLLMFYTLSFKKVMKQILIQLQKQQDKPLNHRAILVLLTVERNTLLDLGLMKYLLKIKVHEFKLLSGKEKKKEARIKIKKRLKMMKNLTTHLQLFLKLQNFQLSLV